MNRKGRLAVDLTVKELPDTFSTVNLSSLLEELLEPLTVQK
jgi:hypothetical protein